MQLSAHEEYGLRCLLRLAERGSESPVSVGLIAEREGGDLPRVRCSPDGASQARGPGFSHPRNEPTKCSEWGDIALNAKIVDLKDDFFVPEVVEKEPPSPEEIEANKQKWGYPT